MDEVADVLREVRAIEELSDMQVASRLVLEAARYPDCDLRVLGVEAARRIVAGCTRFKTINVPAADWRPRTETPPAGMAWASDGAAVWLIHTDGKPIPAEAYAVKFWTIAFIPTPPQS